MRRDYWVILLIGVLCTFWASNVVATSVVNGEFETGDLTGWTVSAFDEFDTPLAPSPFISVTDVGGNNVAEFKTGEFADGLFIATLEQSFPIIVAEPILGFDFTLPAVLPDPTGTGTSPFFDSLFVSADNGVDTFDLLLIDQFGALPDPFGTAPGDVTLGVPSDPFFDFSFKADLSILAGETITLFFDVIQEDDGFQFDPFIDNVQTSSEPTNVIPEPNSVLLLGLGIAMLAGGAMKRKRSRSER